MCVLHTRLCKQSMHDNVHAREKQVQVENTFQPSFHWRLIEYKKEKISNSGNKTMNLRKS